MGGAIPPFLHMKFTICTDCHVLNATGDASFLDYHYQGDEAQTRYTEINNGLDKLAKHGYLITGERTDEFSKQPCDSCLTNLAGERYSLTTYTTLNTLHENVWIHN